MNWFWMPPVVERVSHSSLQVWVTAVNLDVVISQLLVKMKWNLIQR